jgi:uncharacterized protein involved in exopolysaccharide biosynthesis/MinD-like ATPase involved in chromosome partitioning or flagellar assembly
MLWALANEHPSDGTTEPDRPRLPEHDVRDVQKDNAPPIARELHFHELVGILYRRSRMILIVTVLGTMLAAIVGLLISPKYTATAEIAVEPQQGVAVGRAFSPTDESPIDTQVTMLSSRDHLKRVLDSLSEEAEFRAAAPAAVRESAATADVAADAPSRPVVAESPADPTTTEVGSLSLGELARRLKMWIGALGKGGHGTAMSAEQLERGLKVMQERRSRIITVSFTSRSPRQAAVVANRIVQLYVDGQIERKRASMSVELARLGERIAEFKSEVKNAAAAAQSVIQQRSAGATTASREGPNSDERMHELLREVAASRAQQDSLQRRQKEIHDKLEFITPDVSIVSPASPPDRPSSFNPILFILPALIICAICASLLAVVVDRLDRGLRSERDINEALSIPCIGLVPQLPRTCTTRPFQYLLAEPFSAYAEAIRSVVVTLQMAAPPRAPKVLLVSSSVPMEGRTTLALSLAAYIAHLGRRVLLVDLDFRRGSILDELDGRAERGLLDLHLQNRPPAEFIQHIPDLGLDYLPMPRCRVDPLALFAREQTPRLLRQLRESYDCVIIDGPPLLGTAESRLLPSMADKLLFVVKWGTTRRDVAENALRLLRGAGSDKDSSELPTAILTRVDLKQHARYRFGDAGEFLLKYRNYYSPSMEA